MKKHHTDQFRHLHPAQQYTCLKMLQRVEETPLADGVTGVAISVMMKDGHTATLSKFIAQPDEVAVLVSWETEKSTCE
ncbi:MULTISPECIES: hypothetical protein [Rahnella]|uniref:Uncharacterized protein n=1 Tax=Rahnella laticis TaxID=2787622 RepID=A0ABS0E887_9GAMM|nr:MULTISPECIES: hypothetical protein [Rahnella]MBF7981222.1 hypothetical protein [Rahnella laticis]MBF8001314.1 hypothetical protein [Rahnella sp. LAC-M12]